MLGSSRKGETDENRKEVCGDHVLGHTRLLKSDRTATPPTQLRRLFEKMLPRMAELVQSAEPFHVNTWGDAVVAATTDTLKIASAALELRNYFLNLNWNELELPRLLARISLHTGPIYMGDNPFSGQPGIVGTQVNLAARVEPVTLPGHVWATDNFISLLEMEDQNAYAWDDLGERPLAKEWGAKRLYRVRFAHEPADLPSLAEAPGVDRHKRQAEDRVQLCKKLLTMGDETQKVAALNKLGAVPTLESLSLLVEYARKQTESKEIRDMAFASLVELNNQACVPDFIDMLKSQEDSSHFVRCAIELLGRLGDPRAFDVLAQVAQATDDSVYDPGARGAALVALSSLKDARAIPLIEASLKSNSDYTVQAGISAAAHARSKNLSGALADVAKAKDKFDPRRRGAAIEAIILAGTGPNYAIRIRAHIDPRNGQGRTPARKKTGLDPDRNVRNRHLSGGPHADCRPP
jgi:HEAT repeat protein